MHIYIYILVQKSLVKLEYPDFRKFCNLIEDESGVLNEFLTIHSQNNGKVNSDLIGLEAGTQLVKTLLTFWEAHPREEEASGQTDKWNRTRSRIVQTESNEGMKPRQNRTPK